MALNSVHFAFVFVLSLTTCLAQLQHPFKQCSRMIVLFELILKSWLRFLGRSAGQVLKASVNAPCGKEYCTFYKGLDARLEFTFRTRKKIIW